MKRILAAILLALALVGGGSQALLGYRIARAYECRCDTCCEHLDELLGVPSGAPGASW